MKQMKQMKQKLPAALLAAALIGSMAGCAAAREDRTVQGGAEGQASEDRNNDAGCAEGQASEDRNNDAGGGNGSEAL